VTYKIHADQACTYAHGCTPDIFLTLTYNPPPFEHVDFFNSIISERGRNGRELSHTLQREEVNVRATSTIRVYQEYKGFKVFVCVYQWLDALSQQTGWVDFHDKTGKILALQQRLGMHAF
jgi:hypothetical protein